MRRWTRRSPVEFDGRDLRPRAQRRLEDERRWDGRAGVGRARRRTDGQARWRTFAICDDFPAYRFNNCVDDTADRGFADDEGLRRPDEHEGHRALPAHDHRSRRPRPRPDLRLRHDRLRRRAVGPALDHDRHEPRRARPRALAPDGREVPVLPARRLRGRHPQGGRADRPGAAEPDPADRRTTSAAASSTSACRT